MKKKRKKEGGELTELETSQSVIESVQDFSFILAIQYMYTQGPLNRWTSQLDLGCTTGGLERVVSVHNST